MQVTGENSQAFLKMVWLVCVIGLPILTVLVTVIGEILGNHWQRKETDAIKARLMRKE